MPGPLKTVWLGLGANLGDPAAQFEKACRLLTERGIWIVRKSGLYHTKPWGKTDQPDFVNQVLETKTGLSPLILLSTVKAIEKAMGRKKSEKWGPRLIDIDILLYEDQIIELPGLTIPHAFLLLRDFCLDPLIELQPNLRHPLLHKTMQELKTELHCIQEVK